MIKKFLPAAALITLIVTAAYAATVVTSFTPGTTLTYGSGILNLATTVAQNQTFSGTLTASGGGTLTGTFGGTPTFSGNLTFSGVPHYTGLSAGTIATGKNLGLDSGGNLVTASIAGGGTIPSTTSALKGDGAGNASAVTGTSTNCVHVDGTSAACSASTGANPTATAADVAVNGSATTFMRSDGAPAIQKSSASVFGLAKVDGTTITAAGGVLSAVTGGAGTVTQNGNLSVHAPLIGGTNGTTDIKSVAVMSDGQLLVGQTGADPLPKTITGCTLTAAGVLSCAGGAGSGVDGGYTPQTVTGTTTITSPVVRVGSGWTTGTLSLPAVSGLTNPSPYCIVDGGAFISGTATLTVAANAADTISGGGAGGSVGPYTTVGTSLCFRVSATHNWALESGSTLGASTAPAHQFANSISSHDLGYARPSFADLSDTAAAAQLPAADTATQGASKLHNVGFSCGWVAGINPNKAVCGVVNQASTISAIIGRVADGTGGTATVSVFKAPSGTACSGGTILHSGSFDANGTANTNQTLTVTTASVAAGNVLCITTTGTTTWTAGTGIGTVTVFLAPS